MRVIIGRDEDARAGDAAAQPVISVKPSMPLREAAELMLARCVNHLVVMDPEALLPVGILSSLDAVDTLAWGKA